MYFRINLPKNRKEWPGVTNGMLKYHNTIVNISIDDKTETDCFYIDHFMFKDTWLIPIKYKNKRGKS